MIEIEEKRVNKYKNTLVIHCLDIVKLIDIEEDEQDYYFVYETLKKGKFSSSQP